MSEFKDNINRLPLFNEPDEDVCNLAQDKKKLTMILPELVWVMILDKLVNKEDVNNCSAASPYFAQFLHKKRVPQVIELLAKHYPDDDFRQNELMKCRLITKGTNAAIEKVFEQNNSIWDGLAWNEESYSFGKEASEKSPQKFMEHFSSSHLGKIDNLGQLKAKRNPILGRGIKLNYSDSDNNDIEAFCRSSLEISRNFGKEIHFLVIEHFHNEPILPMEYFYRFVVQFVENCPNLIKLSLEFMSIWTPPTPQTLINLKNAITFNPFPKLNRLERLESNDLPCCIFREVMNKNNHIRHLKITRCRSEFKCEYPVFMKTLPYLCELDVDMYCSKDYEEFEKCQFPLNLEKLNVKFRVFHPFVAWSRVFKVLETKLNPDKCTHLEVHLPQPRNRLEIKSVLEDTLVSRFNLPNLQKFVLSNNLPYISLDFLLPCCQSLNEVEVFNWGQGKKNDKIYERLVNKQEILFVGFREKIPLSNISVMLPRLKKLIVCGEESYKF